MRRIVVRWYAALLLLLVLSPAQAGDAGADAGQGHLQETLLLPSRHVPERPVRIWLPPGYPEPGRRYPVLYMHDGQNAFARAPSAGSGFGSWETDLAMERLLAQRRIRPAIVVAIDNTPNRSGEYMPGAAYRMAQAQDRSVGSSRGVPVGEQDIRSDEYLRFIVEELKPYVDAHYRTAPGPEDTFVMGSSMGGLISLYAIAEYPQVFGAAAALSTHWPIGDGIAVDYLRTRLPDPATHRLYLDRGTETLDAGYGPYQDQVDRIMEERGYVEGRGFESRVFEGAAHNERSWSQRLEIPLEFLLGR